MFLRMFLGCFWDMCRMFWDIFMMFLGCFWGCFWDVFGMFLGCFWDICGMFLGYFGTFWDSFDMFQFLFHRSCGILRQFQQVPPTAKEDWILQDPRHQFEASQRVQHRKNQQTNQKLPVLGGQKSSQDVWNHPKESWWILVNPDESWRILVNPGASVREHALTARFPVKLCKRFTANGGETPRIPMNPKESQRILKDRKDGRRRQDGKVEMEEKQPIIQWSDAVRR